MRCWGDILREGVRDDVGGGGRFVGEEDLLMVLFIYHIESYDHYSIV